MVHNAIFPDLRSFFWKSESAKMTQNGLSSPNCFFWFQPYRSFQKSPRNLRGINYQMEYMWWAPHMHNNSPKFQGESQLRSTLYRSLIVTLYDRLWQLMTTYDSFWQLLTTFHNFSQLFTTFDNFWQLLTNFDNFWQLMITQLKLFVQQNNT